MQETSAKIYEKSLLLDSDEIRDIVKKLGSEINSYYMKNKLEQPLIVVGLLKGSFIFMADLVRELFVDTHIEFMTVSSYNNKNQQEKELKIILDLNTSISGRDVLLVEDIVDTGLTFSKILELLNSRNPKSLNTCALLNKKECRVVEVPVNFSGIDIPDKFVYGYGLDDAQSNRHLPYIGVKE
jgi:hypoxanthine phosphoribosyltransferase